MNVFTATNPSTSGHPPPSSDPGNSLERGSRKTNPDSSQPKFGEDSQTGSSSFASSSTPTGSLGQANDHLMQRLGDIRMRLTTDESLAKAFGHIYSRQLISFLRSSGLDDLVGGGRGGPVASFQHPDLMLDLMSRPPGRDSDLLLISLSE